MIIYIYTISKIPKDKGYSLGNLKIALGMGILG